MTREEALKKLADAKYNPDKEVAHIRADEVLCELLHGLGFDDVVEAFESIDKWYA